MVFTIVKLYSESSEYFELFEYVSFENASAQAIVEFLSVFDFNDVTHEIWKSISNRLKCEIKIDENEMKNKRYKNNFFIF